MSAVGNRYAISRCSSSAPSSTAIRIAVVKKTAPRDMVIGFQEIMRGVYVLRLRMHSDHKAPGPGMLSLPRCDSDPSPEGPDCALPQRGRSAYEAATSRAHWMNSC